MPAVAIVAAIAVVVVPISIIAIVVVIAIMEATRSDREVGATATVNPNAAISESPCAAIDARGLTFLANDFNAAIRVHAAEVTVEVVRRARNFVIVRVWHCCES